MICNSSEIMLHALASVILLVPSPQAAPEPFQAGRTAARPALPSCPLQHLVRTASISVRCTSLHSPPSPPALPPTPLEMLP